MVLQVLDHRPALKDPRVAHPMNARPLDCEIKRMMEPDVYPVAQECLSGLQASRKRCIR